MPTSIPLMDDDVLLALEEISSGCSTALDVGVGCGKSAALIKKAIPTCEITGLEPYAPYINRWEADLRPLCKTVLPLTFDDYIRMHPDKQFGLIMFGDVLEHMRWADMVSALHDAAYHSRHFFGVFPDLLVQGPSGGNLYEMHRCRVDYDVAHQFRIVRHTHKEMPDGYKKHFIWWRGYLS